MSIIEVKSATQIFLDSALNEVVSLRDVSLSVKAGEFVCLVGESGCGKTTLLNLISGIYEPTAGSVTVEGQLPMAARNSMGFMFARDGLYPWRTAIRNTGFGMEIARRPRREIRSRSLECLSLVGLEGHQHKYPWQLSQGMRQRVAIARTLANDPSILLMDEPFAAVDAQTRENLQDMFLRIWEEQRKTVVFVTHDLTEAIALADRIVLMRRGEIADEVSVDFARPRNVNDLRTSAEFVELYKHLHTELTA